MSNRKLALALGVFGLVFILTVIIFPAQDWAHAIFSKNESAFAGKLAVLEGRVEEIYRSQQLLQQDIDKLNFITGADSGDLDVKELSSGVLQPEGPVEYNPNDDPSTNMDFRKLQLKRLINVGFNEERAEYVLSLWGRFEYDQMQVAYKLQHLPDNSSPEAQELMAEFDRYSSPFLYMSKMLSKEEFDLYAKSVGMKPQLTIGKVLPDSQASRINLKQGDQVLSYNGASVVTIHDLRQMIQRIPPGKSIPLEIIRKGKDFSETVYISSGPLGILSTE
ncbi:PDZ domain-containing protein [Microbulbifer variabilis]|uniref:PDZ domain-containing protein n=1 Tax=Microbulbifer variabilis TaxID=266805 RepID=UPI001CFCA422|nr:PDZ domain-containing protein [Microbulbifer variabilis]